VSSRRIAKINVKIARRSAAMQQVFTLMYWEVLVLDCEQRSIICHRGCGVCFIRKTLNESGDSKSTCWEWAKAHDDQVQQFVQQVLDDIGADGKSVVFCTTCQTLTIIDPKKIEFDDYVRDPVTKADGTYVIKCNKCGELLPVIV